MRCHRSSPTSRRDSRPCCSRSRRTCGARSASTPSSTRSRDESRFPHTSRPSWCASRPTTSASGRVSCAPGALRTCRKSCCARNSHGWNAENVALSAALWTPISTRSMPARRLLLLLALCAAGCGGGGETRPPPDGSPPVDAAGSGGRGGATGAAGTGGAGGAIAGAGGSVAPGAEIGAACAMDGDCKSGHCFDSICCRSDCADLCQSCAQPGSVGTCMNVPVGADPRNDCSDEGITSCGRNGFCDGTGACALYAYGAICKAQSCAGSTVTFAALCDGEGACSAATSNSCGQYLCGS